MSGRMTAVGPAHYRMAALSIIADGGFTTVLYSARMMTDDDARFDDACRPAGEHKPRESRNDDGDAARDSLKKPRRSYFSVFLTYPDHSRCR